MLSKPFISHGRKYQVLSLAHNSTSIVARRRYWGALILFLAIFDCASTSLETSAPRVSVASVQQNSVEHDASGKQAQLEHDIYRRVNQARQQNGLPALRYSQRLAQVARTHSREMLDLKYIGHISPRTGTPADRLKKANIPFLVSRENVARAYSTKEAMQGLMNSPGHRANILSSDVNEVGVGVVIDAQERPAALIVTQNFTRSGQAYHQNTASEQVLKLINQQRRRANLPVFIPNAQLKRLAEQHVITIARYQGDTRVADQNLSKSLTQVRRQFRNIEGVLIRLSVLDAVEQAQEIRRPGKYHVGIGTQQMDNQIVIFLLLGRIVSSGCPCEKSLLKLEENISAAAFISNN